MFITRAVAGVYRPFLSPRRSHTPSATASGPGTLAASGPGAVSTCLVYTGDVLDRDWIIAGPVRAVLHVATFAPTTDFTAKLVDVHPGGAAFNVTEGIHRRRYFKTNRPEGWSPITEKSNGTSSTKNPISVLVCCAGIN